MGGTDDQTLPVVVPGLSGVVDISAYYHHVVALKGDGTVWVWGQNQSGQCGVGDLNDCLSPVKVEGLSSIVGCKKLERTIVWHCKQMVQFGHGAKTVMGS